MTPQEVRERVAEIRKVCDDAERAHSLEDALHQRVLNVIGYGRLGIKEQRALAREAMKTTKIEFPRYAA